MKQKIFIPFIMLALYFSGSYDQLGLFYAVWNYEVNKYPSLYINIFRGDRDTQIRQILKNIKKRKPTLQEQSLSPNYENLRNKILGLIK